MNERIQELLAKHVSPPNLAVDRDAQGQHTAHVTYTVSQAEMNNLLEAVIWECADLYKNEDGRLWFDKFQYKELKIYSKQIKQHFGVEEMINNSDNNN